MTLMIDHFPGPVSVREKKYARMEFRFKKVQLRIRLLELVGLIYISSLPLGSVQVRAAPIKVTLDTLKNCVTGSLLGIPASCCPGPEVDLDVPVVDFILKRDRTPFHRVRKALQCLSGEELRTYTQKLTKAYALMQALPPSDPRSLHQHEAIHCACGTGSFIQDGLSAAGNFTIDIHFSWLFLPWHRMFIYFHERILQKLLHDPTFTLHFWNFDNGLDGTNARGKKGAGCLKPGHFFPDLYNDNSTSTFRNRSSRVLIPNLPVDLTFPVTSPSNSIDPPLRFVDKAVPRNREVMRLAMERGTIPRDFFGIPFKYGDVRPPPIVGGGSLEFFPHNSMHAWVGGLMAFPTTANADPIFYPAHSNVERLWDVWMKLGDNRKLQPTDPDWLNTEFLFWDENQLLRRVKIRDFLNIDDLGYSYEKVYDASWMS